jgi:hypothetical protein
LSGITDAEGCFTVSFLKNSIAYRYRFILTQKWEANKSVLNYIADIFKENSVHGAVVPHDDKNVWDYRINGIKNCKGLFLYFDKYNLYTKKKYSYNKWKIIYSRIVKKDHLNLDTRLELIELSKQINKSL